jgi:8-oxo-dGTP diphosphatase
MENRKRIEVVAAIIRDDDGRIFATQRGYGAMKDGWEFPGGKMEAGETPEQALRREIKEELDTLIAVEDLLTTVEWAYPDFHLTMHCYWCHVESGSLTLKEHEAARWLNIDQIDTVDWLPADMEVIKEILALLKQDKLQQHT